jgi:hypothetical protein
MKSAFLCCLAMLCGLAHAQTTSQFIGTVSAMRPEGAEIVVKPDKGEAIAVKVSTATIAQRIKPGERDLKNATVIAASDVAVGDRVLVALEPGTADLRRIVIMSATEITKRDEADRLDWIKRGVSGIVRERKGDTIILGIRGPAGETRLVVKVSAKTSFRRYGPDTVRFSDARNSSINEIKIGDQVRARGENSGAGPDIAAEDIVSGTFETHVGSVVSVDLAARRLEVNEQSSTKTLFVNLSPDTQIKGMPDFGATMGGGPDRGGPPSGPPGGMPGSGLPGGMPGGAPAGGPPDVAKMVEQMPGSSLDTVRPGQTVIVSSTRGVRPDELTAITMVVNADMLIRMVTAFSGRGGTGRGSGSGQGVDMGGQGMSMGGTGFDLSGITP